MGTPQFAVPCLERILADGHQVAGVYTQPDKPQGRGYHLAAPPVKELALREGIPVWQPASFREEGAVQALRQLAPEAIVVVAYGRILPEEVLAIPPKGCINVHASLLPKYRGAGPIQWSVINGEQETGVTTMYMEKGLDTGDMILSAATPIGPEETAGQLQERLAQLGAQVLSITLKLVEEGKAPRTRQEDALSSYAPMLEKELGRLDYEKPAAQLHNLIRGLAPSPGAFTMLDGKRLKIHAARVAEGFSGQPGMLLDDRRLIVGCGEGTLELLEVQLEGSKRMNGEDFLRGKRLKIGKMFTTH